VLKELAERVSGNLRSFDTVARMGGEEFVIVMPDTNVGIACAVAERLRQDIENNGFTVPELSTTLPITISIGVATARENGDTSESILKRADDALYHAKDTGRNRAVLNTDGVFESITPVLQEEVAGGGR